MTSSSFHLTPPPHLALTPPPHLSALIARDAIPVCNPDDFVKEASEVPNFLREVEACRKHSLSDAAEGSGEVSGNGNIKSDSRRFLSDYLFSHRWWKVPGGSFSGNGLGSPHEDPERERNAG